jgi:hypothetical protein
MALIVITPFDGARLTQAGRLLTRRRNRDRQRMPLLPARPEDSANLAVAAVHPPFRRLGVMQAPTRCSLQHARQAGFRRSLTDWRSANLESARVLLRWGYRPAVIRLVRRMDLRIAWAKQCPPIPLPHFF